jgi:hypothetical protein
MAGKSLIGSADSLTELRQKVDTARSFLKPGDKEEIWYRVSAATSIDSCPRYFAVSKTKSSRRMTCASWNLICFLSSLQKRAPVMVPRRIIGMYCS